MATIASNTTPRVDLPTHTSPSRVQKVVGRLSPADSRVEQFCGIPYGVIPGRWQHSTLRTSLPDDTFDAGSHGPKCPQPIDYGSSEVYQAPLQSLEILASEFDCLNLFISRPSSEAFSVVSKEEHKNGLPVFVFIHGGGLGYGASTDAENDPSRLVARSCELGKPIIAVMINYRVNILGFLASTPVLDSQVNGIEKGVNFGIRDQKLALNWIKQNISSFGGDSGNVLLCGQSAGACSVNTQVLDARNSATPCLIQRAIIQSGAFTTVGLAPQPVETHDEHWRELCDALGFGGLSGAEQAVAMREVQVDNLLKVVDNLGGREFSLVSDGITISGDRDKGWNVHLGGDIDHGSDNSSGEPDVIEVLIGDTMSEAGSFVLSALNKLDDFQAVLKVFETEFPDQSAALEVLATWGCTPETPKSDLHKGITEFVTESLFGFSIHFAYQELRHSGDDLPPKNRPNQLRPSKAQLYRIKFGNPFPGPFEDEAHHCVDLIYVFDAFHDSLVEQDKKDAVKGHRKISNIALMQQMQEQWISFVFDKEPKIDEDLVLIYDKDRSIRMESLAETPYWIDLNKKFDVIAKYRHETALLTKRLMALARAS